MVSESISFNERCSNNAFWKISGGRQTSDAKLKELIMLESSKNENKIYYELLENYTYKQSYNIIIVINSDLNKYSFEKTHFYYLIKVSMENANRLLLAEWSLPEIWSKNQRCY